MKNKTKTSHLYLTPEAREALDAALKAGFTKSGFASAAIVEKSMRGGLVKPEHVKGD